MPGSEQGWMSSTWYRPGFYKGQPAYLKFQHGSHHYIMKLCRMAAPEVCIVFFKFVAQQTLNPEKMSIG
jgi:hypothetical protein